MKNAITHFTRPFTNKDELFCLSSDNPATKEVKTDLLEAHGRWQQTIEEFTEKMLVDKSIPFHEPIKQMQLKTFALMDVAKKV